MTWRIVRHSNVSRTNTRRGREAQILEQTLAGGANFQNSTIKRFLVRLGWLAHSRRFYERIAALRPSFRLLSPELLAFAVP